MSSPGRLNHLFRFVFNTPTLNTTRNTTGMELRARAPKTSFVRIRTKLVFGALALSSMPVVFLVVFSVGVLNTNLNKWFSRPGELIKTNYITLGNAIESAIRDKAQADAQTLAIQPEARDLAGGNIAQSAREWCRQKSLSQIFVVE